MEMGFERKEAQNALRIAKNDYELACDLLLNSD